MKRTCSSAATDGQCLDPAPGRHACTDGCARLLDIAGRSILSGLGVEVGPPRRVESSYERFSPRDWKYEMLYAPVYDRDDEPWEYSVTIIVWVERRRRVTR